MQANDLLLSTSSANRDSQLGVQVHGCSLRSMAQTVWQWRVSQFTKTCCSATSVNNTVSYVLYHGGASCKSYSLGTLLVHACICACAVVALSHVAPSGCLPPFMLIAGEAANVVWQAVLKAQQRLMHSISMYT